MNSETPFEGDLPDDGDDAPYEWLDEWLCEYVDGTMDPSLEAVFEQYVQANPELKAHVERLQQTRDLLCECGLPNEAPSDVEEKICAEVECEMMHSSDSVSDSLLQWPVVTLGMVSSVSIALVVGFLVGATVVNPTSSPFSTSSESMTTDAPRFEVQTPVSNQPQTPPFEAPLLKHSTPLSGSDSSNHSSALTTIGLP